MPALTVGTRTSNLARWQTDHVVSQLQSAWPEWVCRVVPFVTRGDTTLDQPLPEIGGKGLFTAELEGSLRRGEIDLAVHSLKDLPVIEEDGVTLGAIPGRADVRDVMVARDGLTLASLPHAAVVGTSSLRRQAQLRLLRPDLDVRSIRGNVETRIRKVHEGLYDATLLAAAGLLRLGLEQHVTDWFALDQMLCAPGQGALAVQCRADDEATRRLLQAIDQPAVRGAVTAERSFLHHLGGGCALPVAAHATWRGAQLQLRGLVAAPDGKQVIRVLASGTHGWPLGATLAAEARARGATEILNHV